jgi:hypothetical protein
MKRTSLLLFAIIFITQHITAQNKQLVPEFLNEITYLQPSDSTLKSLEKAKAKYVTKMKALGYGGFATNCIMDGEQSKAYFASADRMTFLVLMDDGKGDPSSWFNLYKTTVKNGKRTATYSDVKAYGGAGDNKDLLSYRVKKRADQVYEIIPDGKLEKGEYIFVNKLSLGNYSGTAVDVFAFGVD